jgi:hypothetical protein
MFMKFVLILALSFLLCSFGKRTEAQVKVPLKMTVGAICYVGCSDENISIKVRLTNVSPRNLVIDKRAIGRYRTDKAFDQFSNEFLKIPKMRVFLGDNFEDDDLPVKEFVTLRPNKTFEYTNKIGRDEFFHVPGKYSVQLSYGQSKDWSSAGIDVFVGKIDSNEAVFHILPCNRLTQQ